MFRERLPKGARILLDARPLQGADALRGKGTYVRGLLGGLLQEGWGPRLGLLIDSANAPPQLPAGQDLVMYRVRRRYHGRLWPWEDAAVLGRDLDAIGPVLFHATSLLLPGSTRVPVVATLHDLIPWAWGGRAMLGERLRWAPGRRRLKAARALVAVSASAARDAELHAGVDPSRVTVVREAPDPAFRPVPGAAERWGLERPFLLYVGALDARKDPGALREAWRAVLAAGADCDLVLAGAAGTQAAAGLEGAVRLGHIPRIEDLAALYSAASCLVFPSRYEGFGLPILEAMACGCPVVAFRNSSIPEVAGDAADLVEDGDAEALGRAAARVLLDPALAARRRASGLARATTFSWRDAARQTAAVWEGVLR